MINKYLNSISQSKCWIFAQKNLVNVLALVALTVLSSCFEDVVEVDLPASEPRVVVDAAIDWVKGTEGKEQVVYLNYTTPYFEQTESPIAGAEVAIRKGDKTFLFAEDTPGVYRCQNFEPELGASYQLKVKMNEATYIAEEIMTSVASIDSIVQAVRTSFGEEELEVKVFLTDPEGVENFYLYDFVDPRKATKRLFVFDDRFTDGNAMHLSYFSDELISGDSLRIKQIGASTQYYDYMSKLSSATGGGFGPFGTIAAEIKGNVLNQTNPDKPALGYFRLSEVDSDTYVIQ